MESNSPNWAEILAAFGTLLAMGGTFWAASEARRAADATAKATLIGSKDSEFDVCISLKQKIDALWEEFEEIDPNNHELIDKKYLKILSHTEWICIYFETRGADTSEPVKHLEEETLKPILRQLTNMDETAKKIAMLIFENSNDKLTFKALKNRLKANGFDFDDAFSELLIKSNN